MESHLRETALRDDALSLEGLELGTVGSCLLGGVDESLGLVDTTVEVTSDLGNEISGIVRTYHPVTNLDVLVKVQHIFYFDSYCLILQRI